MTTEQKKACRKLIRALRSGKYGQCTRTLINIMGDGSIRYCIQGLAYFLIGYDEVLPDLTLGKNGVEACTIFGTHYQVKDKRWPVIAELCTAYGLNLAAWTELALENDRGVRFKDLADDIEKLVNRK